MENLSINEPSGWNNRADIGNRKSFIHVFGREPRDVQEVYSWINDLLDGCIGKTIRDEDEYTLINGAVHCTRWFHYE